jgi:hypothetical protein
MELAIGLSPRVSMALPDLVARIADEAGALGQVFHPRAIDAAPVAGRALDLGRLAAR